MADDTVAEDNTETAGDTSTILAEEGQDTNTEGAKNTSTPAGDTEASEDKTAEDDDAAKSKDTKGDEEDGDDEAESTSYDDLEIPEGMEVDEAALGNFKDLAASMNDGKGLSKEDAQKIVDFRAEMVKAGMAQWETIFSERRGEIHSDKEIGGDNFASRTIPRVLAAAEKFGDADMIKALKEDKMYGEFPPLIRLLNRVGATLSEDKLVKGGKKPAGKGKKDASDVLYPEK